MIIPIDKFFAEMELTEEEQKRREDLAEEMLILFSLFFSEIEAERILGKQIDAEYYKEMLYRQYCDKVEVYIILVAALLGSRTIDEELKGYIKERVSDIVDTTLKYGDDYYTSSDRATLLSCNEANFVGNDSEYRIAKYQGYRNKVWLTMKDEKVRLTHMIVDGQKIGIDEYFKVGQAEMLFPMDMSRNAYEHPEEVVNCRCVVQYVR